MLSLVTGVITGVARLGWPLPDFWTSRILDHGVLMIPAFFGAVISLERAVAIGKGWAYLAPLCSALGGLLLLSAAPPGIGLSGVLIGSLIFAAASVQVISVQQALHNWILLGGALMLIAGNLLLMTQPALSPAILCWIAFLVLTIAGERLELSRLVLRDDGKRRLLEVFCGGLFVAAPLAVIAYGAAETGVALLMVLIAVWLARYDVARRTVRQTGLPRFTAVCMLAGYFWLCCAGLLMLTNNLGVTMVARDVPLHAIFLGFVFSMVIGHALIIFPAVTRLKIPYSPLFYLPLLLLHGTLALRVAGGVIVSPLYAWGGLLNALALLVFILMMVYSVARGIAATRPSSH